jgi:hypothetical protein
VNTLDGLRLKKALATLRGVEQAIKSNSKWMATLMAFKGSPVDARHLLEICDKITRESIDFERVVAAMVGEAKTLSRSIPAMPPKQLTLSKYTPSSVGELKDLQAVAARVQKQLVDLRADLGKFRGFANQKMNDPNRTSDGEPIKDLFNFLMAILDILVKAKKG